MPRRKRIHVVAEQGALFVGAPKPQRVLARKAADWIDVEFAKFHRKHPEVLEQLILHTERLLVDGRQHYGIGAIFENFRWHRRIPVENDPAEDYKLNNNFRSRYVRMMIALRPTWEAFFELRALRSERRRR